MALHSVPVKTAGRLYLIELGLTMGLYAGALFIRPWLLAAGPGPLAAAAIKILPVVPLWLCLWAVIRQYRRIDEYARLRMLKAVALAFGVGSCLLMSYVFLTDLGLPPLAITWAFPTLAVSWAITSAIFAMQDK